MDPKGYKVSHVEIRDLDFNSSETIGEEVLDDTCPLLMVQISCLTPQIVDDDRLRNNIVQSTCTILGKVCHFVIDVGRGSAKARGKE